MTSFNYVPDKGLSLDAVDGGALTFNPDPVVSGAATADLKAQPLVVAGPYQFIGGSVNGYGLLTSVATGDPTATTLANFFGNGADGDIVKNSTTTMTTDAYFNNLTINDTFVLNTAGFRVFVRGTLTLVGSGSIRNLGGNASGQTAGAAGAAGSLAGGQAGKTGGNTSTNGTAGTNGAAPSNGGGGGSGGNSPSNTGGSGGVQSTLSAVDGNAGLGANLLQTFWMRGVSTWSQITGGASGGSGAGGVNGVGGGSGGGGGTLLICAKKIVGGSGACFLVTGGNGGNGAAGASPGGGGGGGGGGFLTVITHDMAGYTGSTINSSNCASGGSPGSAGGGGAAAGIAGGNGVATLLVV